MDDLLAINTAKSKFRDAFNDGNADGVLAIADPDLVSFADGQPSEFGKPGLDALKTRLHNLFSRYAAKLVVIEMEIRVEGSVAHAYGWHELTLTPKDGGAPFYRRNRYLDVWRKNNEGTWKLLMYVDNQDIPDPFRPESI
jgi:ketosteroid isomerase-like protein